MAASTRTRPQTRTTKTVRYAPRPAGSSPAGFGSPRPSSAAARPRTGGRTQQGSGRDPLNSPLPPELPATGGSGRSQRSQGQFRVNRRPGPSRGLTGGRAHSPTDTNYGGVIVAEFVGVILVIALAPVAKGESQSGVSPYAGGDMVKLAAATLLYVILGFVAMGGHGAARVAAWLGGLALITVGLAEGTVLAQEVGLFTGNLLAASQGAPSGGSPLSNAELGLPATVGAGIGAAVQQSATNLGVAESGGQIWGPGQETAPT